MRVTSAVREYVHKVVLAKVADRIKAAEEAKAAAENARAEKVEKARDLCGKICAEAQAKFVKEAKKLLGLTFVSDTYDWGGNPKKDGNRAVKPEVGADDFVETVSKNCSAARYNPCAKREAFYEALERPTRIREAAGHAADRLLFELELGKVAKKELDELLRDMKVEV